MTSYDDRCRLYYTEHRVNEGYGQFELLGNILADDCNFCPILVDISFIAILKLSVRGIGSDWLVTPPNIKSFAKFMRRRGKLKLSRNTLFEQ